MRTALRIKEPVEIKTNGRTKILVNGEEMALTDITAVRYAFGKDESDCGFLRVNGETGQLEFNEAARVIAANRATITRSLHIIELNVVNVDMTTVVNGLRQICGNVAIFLYVNFDGYTEKFERQLALAAPAFGPVDRLMVRERADHTLTHKELIDLKKYVQEKMGDPKTTKVGFCDSPVGCGLGLSCLSAVLCRELAAKYGDDIDMVVPSQNHEGLSNSCDRACNCIGFTEVNTIAALDPVNVAKKSSKEPSESSGEAKTKKKASLGKNVVIRW